MEEHLATRSYLLGYQPTQADALAHDYLAFVKPNVFRKDGKGHLARWYRHIDSFGPEERKQFPVSGVLILRWRSCSSITSSMTHTIS